MTREEAIDLLDNLIGMIEDNHESDYDTALKMAIKALEQEPCEDANANQHNSNALNDVGQHTNALEVDAISRQAVLVSIKNLYPDMPIVDIFGARRKWLEKYAPYFECENAVEQLPSVKPQEQKTGHWIHIDDVMSVFDDFMCGEVDEEGTETFLEMLKDKAESEK